MKALRAKDLLVFGILSILVGCESPKIGESDFQPIIVEPTPTTFRPLASYVAPVNPDDFLNYTTHYNGAGGPATQVVGFFGNTGNGNNWGNFAYSGNTFTLQRGNASGPCSNGALTAPNCGFTWGSGSTGVYKGYGIYSFPPMNEAHHPRFDKLDSISVTIKMSLLTGELSGGFAACGLNIGFGTAGHVDLPLMPVSLSVNNRSSKQDMFYFAYNIVNGGQDMFRIETPINGANGGFNADARWDTEFNMTEGSPLIANGDSVTFRMDLTFDHDNEQITVTTTPIATNKTLALMNSQTIVWDYFAPHTTVVGGMGRAGIATDHVGAIPLSKEEVLGSPFSIGFHKNGVVKECSFSNLMIRVWD